ncbi:MULTISPECIES: MFS transporter [Francisella]|uniref:MFS transporter n=1 Tax=Francisella opportunistica TaxID=2016517 RepID=A0A345JS76_9GAMM|nr:MULTISPECIES: MFS transporter [Francisella]APC91935.1 L-Proline/Glycine betaine transporter ProP [Francisella sp. MA067296]AXH30172.1 MFS transporter [Francisella opportunistica]AXH31814.1 MFS transporter [Francisella opportunistica]AXH33460.1 MFS transporter [Francisella opportunistica]
MKNYNRLLFSSLGAAFEYYDLAIYSIFAVSIGSKFFDKSSSISNTLLVFLVYIVGYLVRPLGAWGFGYLADKKGRAFILRLNMILLFFSTLALALLPTIETIGVLATILFVGLRCIQSLAVGAEIPVSVVYIIENYPQRQGLVTSMVFCCLSIGIMMTSLVLFILNHFTSQSFIQDYGWRIGFFIGACFTFLLFFLRKNIIDIPRVVEALDKQRSHNYIFIIKLTISIALVACIAMLTTQLYMFLPAYHQMYIVSDFDVSDLLLTGSIVMAVSCLIGGFISDYVSKPKMMALLILITIAIVPLFYKNMIAGTDVFACFIILSIIMGFFAPTYNVIIANFFRLEYRCRGYGIAYNLGYLVFSAGVPVLTISLITATSSLLVPVYLIVFAGAVSFIGIAAASWFMKKA